MLRDGGAIVVGRVMIGVCSGVVGGKLVCSPRAGTVAATVGVIATDSGIVFTYFGVG